MLHVAMRIGAAEHLQEIRPVIVIADEQMRRQRKPREPVPQRLIGRHIAALRQVAGQHAEGRIGMVLRDVGQCRIEPRMGVKAPQALPRFRKMQVRQVDELHG